MRARLPALGALAVAVGALLISAVTVRDLSWVVPDAANYGIVARSLIEGDGYTENVVPVHALRYESVRHLPELHGLLHPFVLVPVVAVLGNDPFALRIPGLTFVFLTGLVVFLWGRRLFGAWSGLLACILTVSSASLVFFGALGTDDTGLAFFLVTTLFLLDRAISTGHDRDFLLAGIVGALALLEKLSGAILAGVFACVPLFVPSTRRGGRLRVLALLYGPLLAAVLAYAARNYAASGGFALRLGPLQGWILKANGYEGMMRLYPHPPTLLESLRMLGPERVLALSRRELGNLFAALAPASPFVPQDPLTALAVPTFVPILALAAMAWLGRRRPVAAVLTSLAVVGGVLLFGIGWHHDLRFLSYFVPLAALWTGGLFAANGPAAPGGGARVARIGVRALVVGVVVTSCVVFLRARSELGRERPHPCRDGVAWLAANTDGTARILAFDPWVVSWEIGREAVMIPTGGPAVVAGVARDYDAHWLLAYQLFTRPMTSRVVMSLPGDADGVTVSSAFDNGSCRVYRLAW